MKAPEIIAIIEEKFAAVIRQKKLEGGDPWIAVDPQHLREVCLFLRDEPRLRFEMLNCISGVDYLEPDAKKAAKAGFEPHMELVYHFSSFTHNHRFTLKLMLPRWRGDQPGALVEVPTISDLWRTADWHEREVYDLCGIWFTDHPDLRRILLAEDWQGYPLRKDYEFPLEYHGIRGR